MYSLTNQFNSNSNSHIIKQEMKPPSVFTFQVLKETLTRHGFTFESETDTEVIPKLAKFVFDKAREGIAFMLRFIVPNHLCKPMMIFLFIVVKYQNIITFFL